MPPLEIGHDPVPRHQPVWMVPLAHEVGDTREREVGATAPRLDAEAIAHQREMNGRCSGRRTECEPCLVGAEAHCPVAATVNQWPEGGQQVEGTAKGHLVDGHRRSDRIRGAGPAWVASRSARVRSPR